LGERPLTATEAGPALFAYDLANRTNEAIAAGFHPLWPSWISLVQAGIFAAFGASDFTARIVFAVFGLILVAVAFATRPYVGRAGAIGAGTILAISPTTAWFSRAATSGIVAIALALATVALFMELTARPSSGRTSALGVTAGLMISADPMGLTNATILVAALAIIGLFKLVSTRHAYLHARVWSTRYGGLAATAILLAVATCILSVAISGASRDDLRQALWLFWPMRTSRFAGPLRALILPLGFYEFLITIAAAGGILTVISLRTRTQFGFFVVVWTALSIAFYAAVPTHQPDQILMIIVPCAILAGIAIEYLYYTRAWKVTRAVLGTLVVLTLYMQLLGNFVYYAPDPAEAPWNQHGNLYWRGGATTIRAKSECNAVLERIAPARVTAYHDGQWPPALRWYLRAASPVASFGAATLVVETNPASAALPDSSAVTRFEYEESWSPRLADLNPRRALAYLLSQKIWGDITSRSVVVRTIPQIGSPAATMILPPSLP
jgi:hypothetical protein